MGLHVREERARGALRKRQHHVARERGVRRLRDARQHGHAVPVLGRRRRPADPRGLRRQERLGSGGASPLARGPQRGDELVGDGGGLGRGRDRRAAKVRPDGVLVEAHHQLLRATGGARGRRPSERGLAVAGRAALPSGRPQDMPAPRPASTAGRDRFRYAAASPRSQSP